MTTAPSDIMELVKRLDDLALFMERHGTNIPYAPSLLRATKSHLQAQQAEIERLRLHPASGEAKWRAQPGPWAHLTKEQTDDLIAAAGGVDVTAAAHGSSPIAQGRDEGSGA